MNSMVMMVIGIPVLGIAIVFGVLWLSGRMTRSRRANTPAPEPEKDAALLREETEKALASIRFRSTERSKTEELSRKRRRRAERAARRKNRR